MWDYEPRHILLIFLLAKDSKEISVQAFVAGSSF